MYCLLSGSLWVSIPFFTSYYCSFFDCSAEEDEVVHFLQHQTARSDSIPRGHFEYRDEYNPIVKLFGAVQLLGPKTDLI